ncbi:MAG TPA: CoA pyrophosphatase [Nannocystis exedens]|nr:CoA pyrophosphatase [Nannocystis exedens]
MDAALCHDRDPPVTASRYDLPLDLGARLEAIGAPLPDPTPLRFAAVLAPLLPAIDALEGPRLLLIERAQSLRKHAGQLALPGGKPEPGDNDLLDTALREAEEEVGLHREGVAVLGRLAPVPTPSGYMIIPYVARVLDDWAPGPVDQNEVAATLTPSLRLLSDPNGYVFRGSADWRGQYYELHEFTIHNPPLWGATARIVFDLLRRLEIEPRP